MATNDAEHINFSEQQQLAEPELKIKRKRFAAFLRKPERALGWNNYPRRESRSPVIFSRLQEGKLHSSQLVFDFDKEKKTVSRAEFKAAAGYRQNCRQAFEEAPKSALFGNIPSKNSTLSYLESLDGLETLQRFYLKWVKTDSWTRYGFNAINKSGEEVRGSSWTLASKRGNRVYVSKLKRMFKEFDSQLLSASFFNPDDKYPLRKGLKAPVTPMAFITLTCDPKRFTREEAWFILGKNLNSFRSSLARKFNCKVSIIKGYESFDEKPDSAAYGYPHIHLVVLLEENHYFHAFWHEGKNPSWRVLGKEMIASSWTMGFCDVLAVSSFGEELKQQGRNKESSSVQSTSHILKYMLKSYQRKSCSPGDKGVLLNSILWGLGMRAFSLSGVFLEKLLAIAKSMQLAEEKERNRRLDKRSDNNNSNSLTEISWHLSGIFPEPCFLASILFNGEPPPECCCLEKNRPNYSLEDLDNPEKHRCLEIVEKHGKELLSFLWRKSGYHFRSDFAPFNPGKALFAAFPLVSLIALGGFEPCKICGELASVEAYGSDGKFSAVYCEECGHSCEECVGCNESARRWCAENGAWRLDAGMSQAVVPWGER